MERDEMILLYDKYLCAFCKESAYLEDICGRVTKGEAVSEREVAFHLSALRDAKDALIRTKAKLGFSGGLDFTDDCNFQGFKYKDGMLSGDYTKLPDIVLPWVREFDEKKLYTYEVGTLIMFHYMVQKERERKERRKRRIEKCILTVKNIIYFLFRVKEEDFGYE